MTTVILFILGTIVGSFLNVAGLRYNSGLTLLGRSSCPYCSRKLKARNLVPILSFFFQRGRCSGCGGKISWQYPIVELWTGLLFATLFSRQLVDGYLSYQAIGESAVLLAFCIYTVLAIYDARHRIIPDLLSYSAIALAILARAMLGGSYLDWLAGPILFAFFALLWLITRGRAIGFGDAKLALSMGLIGGAAAGFSGAVLAFWIGAACGLALMASGRIFPLLRKSKQITMKTEIPFAPLMILGLWLALIFDLDLLHASLL